MRISTHTDENIKNYTSTVLSSLAQTTQISTQNKSGITPITDRPFATSEFLTNMSEFEMTSEIQDSTESVATVSSTSTEKGE